MSSPAEHDAYAVLGQFLPGPLPERIESLGGLGGLSGARFWRFEQDGDRRLMRRWPVGGMRPKRLSEIHNALRHAARQGIDYLPVPLPSVAGPTQVEQAGVLWELTPWLPGKATTERPLTDDQLRSGVTAMARFHQAMADFSPSPATVGHPASIANRLAKWRQAKRSEWLASSCSLNRPEIVTTENAARMRQLVRKLLPAIGESLASVEQVRCPLQIIIGDLRQDHLLFSGDELTGLVDFGALAFDSPVVDLARLLGDSAGEDPGRWRTGIKAYRAIGPSSPEELRLIQVLDASGLVLASYNWLAWLYAERREFPDPQGVGLRINKLLGRLESLASGTHPTAGVTNS
jgi:homoserine kinase type II